jgi:hypothetical protein
VATWRHATQGQTWNQGPIPQGGQTIRHSSANCQLSLRGTCIRGSSLLECTTHCAKRTEPRCPQNMFL